MPGNSRSRVHSLDRPGDAVPSPGCFAYPIPRRDMHGEGAVPLDNSPDSSSFHLSGENTDTIGRSVQHRTDRKRNSPTFRRRNSQPCGQLSLLLRILLAQLLTVVVAFPAAAACSAARIPASVLKNGSPVHTRHIRGTFPARRSRKEGLGPDS